MAADDAGHPAPEPRVPQWSQMLNGELDGQAKELAARLAVGAADRDRDHSGAEYEMAELKASGLLFVTASRALGGGGTRWSDALRALRNIARVDNPSAMLLGYHWNVFHTAESLGAFDGPLRSCVENNDYLAGVVNVRDAPLLLVAAGSGYRLNGRKTFSTGVRLADQLFIAASFEERPAIVVMSARRDGITAGRDWDSFGERASESGSVAFDDVAVAREEVLITDGHRGDADAEGPWRSLAAPLIQLLFVNLYLGAAEGALEDAVDYVRTKTRPWVTAKVSSATDDPYILEQFGRFAAAVQAVRALADVAGLKMDDALARRGSLSGDDRGEVAIAVYAAKVEATRVALDITGGVFELMGARSTSERYGFDRRWRDVRVHTLHDPVAYKAREVGAHLLNRSYPEPDNYS